MVLTEGAGAADYRLPSAGETLIAIIMGGLAVSSVVALPLVGPMLADIHARPADAVGLVGFANLAGTALGSLVVTLYLRVLPWRRTAVLACLTAFVCQWAVSWMPRFGSLLALELLAGVGAGLLLALSAAIIGAGRNPDRGFAYILALQAVTAVGVLVGLPLVFELWGLVGAMLLVALPFLAVAVLCPGLRPAHSPARQVDAQPDTRTVPTKAIAIAASHFMYSAAVGIPWVYAGSLGKLASLSDGDIGAGLAVGNLAAIAGSLSAAGLGVRLGRRGPILLLGVLIIVGTALLTPANGLPGFYIGCALYLFAWGAGLPFFMGGAAYNDDFGRVTSLMPMLAFAGMTAGPVLVTLFPAGTLYNSVMLTLSAVTIASIAGSFFALRPAYSRPGDQIAVK